MSAEDNIHYLWVTDLRKAAVTNPSINRLVAEDLIIVFDDSTHLLVRIPVYAFL